MSQMKIIALGLAHILILSACHAGSSERRKSLLTENLLGEAATVTVTEPETGTVIESGTQTEVPAQETTEESGTGVNNGIGPMGKILSCLGEDDNAQKVAFSINNTAAISYKQGVLSIGDETIILSCDEVDADPNEKPILDKSKAIWSCSEQREGEGLYHVDVLIHGFTGMTLGTVTVDQISPLKPAHVSTMGCRK